MLAMGSVVLSKGRKMSDSAAPSADTVWLSHSYRLSSGGLSVMTLHEKKVLCLHFQSCYFN